MYSAWRWLSVGLAGLLVLTGPARGDDSGPRPLDIYFIDVMGGASTLIVTPEKESILIDSGWPGFDDRDPRRIVHVLKDLAGCDHLDHLVTTHWHVDHHGASPAWRGPSISSTSGTGGCRRTTFPVSTFPTVPKPTILWALRTARLRMASGWHCSLGIHSLCVAI